MSRKKTFPPYLEEGFSDIQPLCYGKVSFLNGNRWRSIGGASFRASFGACKQWVGRGQPWFYLRLATKRGTIALLGCPREHTVPRETFA
jgi:hypothetical protein